MDFHDPETIRRVCEQVTSVVEEHRFVLLIEIDREISVMGNSGPMFAHAILIEAAEKFAPNKSLYVKRNPPSTSAD